MEGLKKRNLVHNCMKSLKKKCGELSCAWVRALHPQTVAAPHQCHVDDLSLTVASCRESCCLLGEFTVKVENIGTGTFSVFSSTRQ